MSHFRLYKLFLLLMIAGGFLTLPSCKKNDSGAAPVITGLRAITPAPNDSVLTKAGPGQIVVIQGSNLATATQVYFNGYPAPFNSGIISDNNITVIIPADMPFASLDTSKLNTVRVVTAHGETTFSFPIIPPPPIITSMTNEYAKAGDKVTIYGNNFFFIDKVIFPGGIEVTSGIVTNATGTSLTLTIPSGITTGGNIQVINQYGTGTSVLLFNDFTTGILNNYDNINNMSWGSGTSNNSATYPGNNGYYGVMNASGVGGGDFAWYTGNRSINTNPAQWVPVSDLSSSLGNYALKFEISVTKPWSAGSIYIVKDYDWTYLAVYNPWKNSDGTSTAFTTNGWQTVVIPLTEFRTKANNLDGTGVSASSMQTLVGSTGSGGIDLMHVNNGTATIDNFEVAIDNIRVEKIK